MIIKTIYSNDFSKEFERVGRRHHFSVEGLNALYDWLNDWYDGEVYELDAPALCDEFTEYKNIEEFHKDYDEEKYPDLDTIGGCTILIDFGSGFIIGELTKDVSMKGGD